VNERAFLGVLLKNAGSEPLTMYSKISVLKKTAINPFPMEGDFFMMKLVNRA
jgi:hypothetical protein